MTSLRETLQSHVDDGFLPGAVGLVAKWNRLEVEAVGSVDVDGTAPMARDSIFRIASITKSITAAAVMMLVDDVDDWYAFARMLLADGTRSRRRGCVIWPLRQPRRGRRPTARPACRPCRVARSVVDLGT